jgi:hypothetical protein
MTPYHRQQSWPFHEPSRFAGSSVIPDLKDSSAALSDAKQLLLNSTSLAMEVADIASVVVAAAAATSKKQSAATWCEEEDCRIPAIVQYGSIIL